MPTTEQNAADQALRRSARSHKTRSVIDWELENIYIGENDDTLYVVPRSRTRRTEPELTGTSAASNVADSKNESVPKVNLPPLLERMHRYKTLGIEANAFPHIEKNVEKILFVASAHQISQVQKIIPKGTLSEYYRLFTNFAVTEYKTRVSNWQNDFEKYIAQSGVENQSSHDLTNTV